MEEELEQRIQKSIDLFMQGYGCCQSVVAAFSDLYGLDETMAKRVSAGFGGGVGRMRMMCGAVSGLVILAGLQCGQTEGSDREGKAHCYKVVQELLANFKEKNGSIICAELLAMNGCKAVKPSPLIGSVRGSSATTLIQEASAQACSLARARTLTPQPSYVPDERNAEYYKKRPCVRKVESAARTFAEYLQSLKIEINIL